MQYGLSASRCWCNMVLVPAVLVQYGLSASRCWCNMVLVPAGVGAIWSSLSRRRTVYKTMDIRERKKKRRKCVGTDEDEK